MTTDEEFSSIAKSDCVSACMNIQVVAFNIMWKVDYIRAVIFYMPKVVRFLSDSFGF